MGTHRSKAYAPVLRGSDKVSDQLRFVLRLAVACHAANVDYAIEWRLENQPMNVAGFYPVPDYLATRFGRMSATITAIGAIPTPKALPKAPALRLVDDSWKPRQYEAEYRLDAIASHTSASRKPGFVLAHSSGLSLAMASDTGEWGTEHGDADPNGKWSLTHTATGLGFGIALPLARATKALLFAAAQPVDWAQPLSDATRAAFTKAGYTVRAEFSPIADREHAKRKLERIALAA